ncbi:MAG: hypothetical protein QF815_01995, partial [Candidatus Peribacteraceae bacterium]|nr:hypothetical protein [Candidatus Peribacteraceae bacterium]
DFSIGFFEQYAKLHKAVPRMNLVTVANENSEFTTGTGYCKNCFLINSSENCEDCYHGKLLQKCSDSMDCSYLYDSQLCYECFSVYKSYNCQYLLFSQNCTDCFFSSNLNSCKNCFLCTNLHQKEYHFENSPLPREEYEARVEEYRGSYQKVESARSKLLELRSSHPMRFANIVNCEKCSGDYIENSKNCLDCYDVNKSEDCRYVQVGVEVKDNYDCSNMYIKIEKCYETLGTIEVNNAAYCLFVFHSNDLLYCEYCFNCSDCFGCIGLTRKQYCIFNKQYSEQEYNNLVPKIVEHMKASDEWGKYFLPLNSPFGYNETLAYEYVPLEKNDAVSQGFLWRDYIDQKPNVEKIIPASGLPDLIDDIPNDILNWAITCEVSGRPFQIIDQELKFYRNHKLPVPHLHPDERHKRRMKLRNPRKLYSRECSKCSAKVESTYAPDKPETVYCEKCYLEAIY